MAQASIELMEIMKDLTLPADRKYDVVVYNSWQEHCELANDKLGDATYSLACIKAKPLPGDDDLFWQQDYTAVINKIRRMKSSLDFLSKQCEEKVSNRVKKSREASLRRKDEDMGSLSQGLGQLQSFMEEALRRYPLRSVETTPS